MTAKNRVIILSLILGTIILILLLILFHPDITGRRRTIYNTNNPNPFITGISKEFKDATGVFKANNEERDDSLPETSPKASVATEDTYKKHMLVPNVNKELGDEQISRKLYNEITNLKAQKLAHKKVNEDKILKNLASSISMKQGLFEEIYYDALNSNTFSAFYDTYHNTKYAAEAVEIFQYAQIINYLMRSLNSPLEISEPSIDLD